MADEAYLDAQTTRQEELPTERDRWDKETTSPDSQKNYTKREGERNWRPIGLSLMIGLGLGLAIGIVASKMGSTAATAPVQPATLSSTPIAPTQTVTTARVETTSIARTVNATGTVAAYDLLPVLARANGLQIKQVLVKEGDVVATGQLMAVLDDSVLQAQIDQALAEVESEKATLLERKAAVTQAEAALSQAIASQAEAEAGREQAIASLAQARADLAQARRELARSDQLENEGAIALQELENSRTAAENATEAVRVAEANIRSAEARIRSTQANISSTRARVGSAQANVSSARANVRSQQAEVKQLQTQLAQTQVLAPSGGIIAERIARIGDVTNGSQQLFSIINNGALELKVTVAETQLPQIKIGAPVQIASDADPRISLNGTVRDIAPLVNAETRQATVNIDLPPNPLLRPGMFLRAAITSQKVESLTVPYEAVQWQPDSSAIVYLIEGKNNARARRVEVGTNMGGDRSKLEIKSGLRPGDRVIVAGAGFVKDGDVVKVVSEITLTTN